MSKFYLRTPPSPHKLPLRLREQTWGKGSGSPGSRPGLFGQGVPTDSTDSLCYGQGCHRKSVRERPGVRFPLPWVSTVTTTTLSTYDCQHSVAAVLSVPLCPQTAQSSGDERDVNNDHQERQAWLGEGASQKASWKRGHPNRDFMEVARESGEIMFQF